MKKTCDVFRLEISWTVKLVSGPVLPQLVPQVVVSKQPSKHGWWEGYNFALLNWVAALSKDQGMSGFPLGLENL